MFFDRSREQSTGATTLARLCNNFEHALCFESVGIHYEVLASALPLLNFLSDAHLYAEGAGDTRLHFCHLILLYLLRIHPDRFHDDDVVEQILINNLQIFLVFF